ncbi:MAG: DUF4956 domain-containing protein [Gemmatimonadetes bacterium]|nr:DUF4956 domain-containing protein [Gemmatimonadota bacterium]
MPFDQTVDPFSLVPLTTGQIVANIAVALICGLIISGLYRWSYRGTSYSATFVSSLVTLAMITAVVIMAIGNNLARAFGLVGAMSIIRFRTAVKDTQDLVFIFLALSIGLAAGVGFHRLAIVGTVVVGGTLWIMGRSGYGSVRVREYLVEIRAEDADPAGEVPAWDRVFHRYCRRHRLLHARSAGGGTMEVAYLVRLIRTEDARALTEALTRVPGVREVSLFHDEEQPL